MKSTSQSNLNVLVVEDEGVVAEAIKERLLRAGFGVAGPIDSGEEAIAVVEQCKPDIVLMDIRLKGKMDGIEAADWIARKFDIPIVFLTAMSDVATLERAKATSPFGYILKPFHEKDLLVTIEVAASRHSLERRLKESEKKYAATLASIVDAVITTDTAGNITFMNPGAESLTGWDSSDGLTLPLEDVLTLIHESTEDVVIKRNNERIPVEQATAQITDDRGKMIGMVFVLRDIRARRHAEKLMRESQERVRHAQELESLSVLVGGVAHNFNNLMAIILGNAQLALTEQSFGSRYQNHLQQVITAARRGGELTGQLTSYAGGGAFLVRRLDVVELLRSMTSLLRLSVPRTCEIRTEIGARIPWVEADPSQLHQALFSVVMNAVEATGNLKGVITIRANHGRFTVAELRAYVSGENLPEGDYVDLEIADTGCGMTAEVQAKIFEPFFTTKFIGRGLGLSAALGIIRSHHGAIRIQSEAGKGTTTSIILPAAPEPASRVIPERHSPETWQTAGTILVVDDEEGVREFAKEALERIGFDVLTAMDGKEGLDLYMNNADRISAVLLDLSMPRMDGTELLRQLRQRGADVPVILSTGYGADAPMSGATAVLAKPYDLEQLRDVLYRILGPGETENIN